MCFFSEFKLYPLSLDFPIASISSIKIKLGALFLASLNNFQTFLAPRPEYFYTNSLPDIEKKDISASLAQAFANIVLPVPGGPVNNAPLGIHAPNHV